MNESSSGFIYWSCLFGNRVEGCFIEVVVFVVVVAAAVDIDEFVEDLIDGDGEELDMGLVGLIMLR